MKGGKINLFTTLSLSQTWYDYPSMEITLFEGKMIFLDQCTRIHIFPFFLSDSPRYVLESSSLTTYFLVLAANKYLDEINDLNYFLDFLIFYVPTIKTQNYDDFNSVAIQRRFVALTSKTSSSSRVSLSQRVRYDNCLMFVGLL